MLTGVLYGGLCTVYVRLQCQYCSNPPLNHDYHSEIKLRVDVKRFKVYLAFHPETVTRRP